MTLIVKYLANLISLDYELRGNKEKLRLKLKIIPR